MEKCFRISYYGCLNTWKSVNRFVFKGVLDTPLVYFYPREQCIPHWPNECWLDSSQELILHIIIYSCSKVEIFQDTCASHNMQIRGAGSFVSSIHMALCNIRIYGDIRTIIRSVYIRPAIICQRAVIPAGGDVIVYSIYNRFHVNISERELASLYSKLAVEISHNAIFAVKKSNDSACPIILSNRFLYWNISNLSFFSYG